MGELQDGGRLGSSLPLKEKHQQVGKTFFIFRKWEINPYLFCLWHVYYSSHSDFNSLGRLSGLPKDTQLIIGDQEF